jgi:pimeloyl-ACP methyl ester carboxylesterase
MAGAAPFQLLPGAIERLTGGDAEAARHLGTDPVTAAELFRQTFEPFGGHTDLKSLLSFFDGALSERDRIVVRRPHVGEALLADIQEASLQQFAGGGWDNVAWVGSWDFDIAQVRCPVRLWYGDQDVMAATANGTWLQAHLTDAHLTILPGYGHLALVEHLTEMLDELLQASES